MKEIEAIKTLVDKELITKEEGYDLIVRLFDGETEEQRGEMIEVHTPNLKKRKYTKSKKYKQKDKSEFSNKDDKYIKDHFDTDKIVDIAKAIKKDVQKVYSRTSKLGLSKWKRKTPGPKPPTERSTEEKPGPKPKESNGPECPFCNSKNTIGKGLRKTKRFGDVPRYVCRDCNKNFNRRDKSLQEESAEELTKKLGEEKLTDKDILFIKHNMGVLANDEMAERLERPLSLIVRKRNELEREKREEGDQHGNQLQ